jgi:C_GCAxxG_C_C family probable redox protein
MNHQELALKYFNMKYHCSQAVLAAYSDLTHLSVDESLKLGSCFGSGMRQGEVCGAATGALMVLGLIFGYTDPNNKEQSNRINDKFLKRFKEVNGSYLCNELLKCDIRTTEGINYAKKNNLFTEFCPKMVLSATLILDEIIKEESK